MTRGFRRISHSGGIHPRRRWNGSSNTAANSRAKQTVVGTSTAVSTRKVGVPGATRPITSPYDTANTIATTGLDAASAYQAHGPDQTRSR
jgi:hypothetical protein